MNWKVHLITFFSFLFAVGTVKLVWDNPKIILYIVLLVIGLLAYGALYLVVKAKIDTVDKK